MPDPYREPIEEAPVPKSAPEKPLPPVEKAAEKSVTETPAPKAAEEKPLPPPPPPAPPSSPKPAPLPKEGIKGMSEDRQLKMLIDLAFNQGIEKAIQAARSTENAYLIDKFHDTLVDELRQQLIEKGKLKEV